MSWITIPNNSNWEYDNNPADPGGAQTALWAKQTSGIRTNINGTEIYTKCRRVGTSVDNAGELNKTYWDAQGSETPSIDTWDTPMSDIWDTPMSDIWDAPMNQ